MFILGKSGTGKSTLLKSIVLQLLYANHGLFLLDPHGDLAEEILDHVPSRRAEDIIYFNPADRDCPVGFNVLEKVTPHQREQVASGFVSACKSIWRDFFGPRLEYILYASTLALLECQNVTLLSIQRMLTDDHYLRWVVSQVKDPVIRRFFEHEYLTWDKRFRRDVTSSILNKTGQLMLAPMVRNVFGQVKRKIDTRFIMDNRRVCITNLSKGQLGDDKASLMGSLLTSSFAQAAMSRSDTAPSARVPFTMIVDEFASFGSDVFASILSEARKYGLRLVIATQYLDQIEPRVHASIFGNVGNLLSFRVGERDAPILEREFGASYTAHTFSSRPNFEVVAKLLDGGGYAEPFVGRVDLPPFAVCGGRNKIVARSRQKYGVPRHIIEGRIERWLGHGQNRQRRSKRH